MLPSYEFWNKEKQELWDGIAPYILTMIYYGGEAGAEALPDSIKILINWDVFNKEAVNYLRQYQLSWVNGISETTRKRATETIGAWIESGETKPMLDKRLAVLFGETRAKTIATTEVTRIYARGNQLAWKASGIVSAQKWQTSQDEKVCALCGPLHDTIVGIDDVFAQSPTDIANSPQMQAISDDPEARMAKASTLMRHAGAYVGGPPRHINCRCWLLPVVSEEGLERELDKLLMKSEVMTG